MLARNWKREEWGVINGCRVSVLHGEKVLGMVVQQCAHLTLLHYALKSSRMVNFMLCVFYHNLKNIFRGRGKI